MKQHTGFSGGPALGRTLGTVRGWASQPYMPLALAVILLLALLILWPLADIAASTLRLTPSDARRLGDAAAQGFTFTYWKQLFAGTISRKMLWQPLMHSLSIALSVSAISIVVGSLAAWLIVRTDLPGKRFFSLAIIIPYMLPAWCKAMAWIAVFKNPRIGGSAGFLSAIGITVPDWFAYGPVAIIAVLSMHNYAYAYLLVSASLSSIGSEFEEMAEVSGASRVQILRRITFPLVLPAILGAFILTFSQTMGTFSVPAILGLKSGYYTLSTMLQNNMMQHNTGTAMAMSLLLIALASFNILLNQRLIGTRKSFVTISGKGGHEGGIIHLGRARRPLALLLLGVILCAVVLPLVILLMQTLQLRLGEYGLNNLTLHYWIGGRDPMIVNGEPGVLQNPDFFRTLKSTMALVLSTSVIAAFCGHLVGYLSSRGRSRLSGRLIDLLVFIPYLIPSIAFGAMYLSMFSTAKTVYLFGHAIQVFPSLYGTFALLVLVSVVKNLPFSSRSGTATMMQIGVELEEAAEIAGAGFVRRMRSIVLPLARSGFVSGFLLIFISVMKELDLIIILVTPQYKTLPYMAYSYLSGGVEQLSNVVALVMFFIIFAVYCLANRFAGADITESLGG